MHCVVAQVRFDAHVNDNPGPGNYDPSGKLSKGLAYSIGGARKADSASTTPGPGAYDPALGACQGLSLTHSASCTPPLHFVCSLSLLMTVGVCFIVRGGIQARAGRPIRSAAIRRAGAPCRVAMASRRLATTT